MSRGYPGFPKGDPPHPPRLAAWPRAAAAAARQAGSGRPRGAAGAVLRGGGAADGQHAEGDEWDIGSIFLLGEMVMVVVMMRMMRIIIIIIIVIIIVNCYYC